MTHSPAVAIRPNAAVVNSLIPVTTVDQLPVRIPLRIVATASSEGFRCFPIAHAICCISCLISAREPASCGVVRSRAENPATPIAARAPLSKFAPDVIRFISVVVDFDLCWTSLSFVAVDPSPDKSDPALNTPFIAIDPIIGTIFKSPY